MKTTAGIMPSLRSIARANECRRDAKHVWAQPCVVDGGHEVSVLQVQAWQLLYWDQRLLGTDTGNRTATACLKNNVTWEQTPGHPANQNLTATVMTELLMTTFKLLNAFFVKLLYGIVMGLLCFVEKLINCRRKKNCTVDLKTGEGIKC